MYRSLLIAAVLIPTIAHAEFSAKKPAEVRLTAAPKAEPKALTIDGMLDKINNEYMVGLRRCYTKGLAEDPSLKAKIKLTFTINAWGHTSGAITGIAPKVDACLTTQVSKWRFPSPRDNRGKLSEASFRLDMLLTQN